MIYFHGSKTGGIRSIIPHESLHGQPLVYLSSNFVVACFYTVNAIEAFFERNSPSRQTHFEPFFPYGFSPEGIPVLDEYYPNATKETYFGKKGFLYSCEIEETLGNSTNISCAVTSEKAIPVKDVQSYPDMYETLCALERKKQLIINRYEEYTMKQLQKIDEIVLGEIERNRLYDNPENAYSVFLRAKFPHLFP